MHTLFNHMMSLVSSVTYKYYNEWLYNRQANMTLELRTNLTRFINLLRSDLPWQAEQISANVSRFYKILVKCTLFQIMLLWAYLFLCVYIFSCDIKYCLKTTSTIAQWYSAGFECGRSRVQSPVKNRVIPKTL